MADLVRVKLANFFDRKAIIDRVPPAARKVLSKAGAFIWRRARTSIRPAGKSNKISQPGQPPRDRGVYRKTILFAYDAQNESVVIGPRADFRGTRQTPRAPEALEFGGVVERGGKTFNYRARPHMRPALEAEADKFPQLFANSIER